MRSKRERLSDQIRQAIADSEMSRNQLCQLIRLSPSTMHRFVHGTGGLSVEMFDRIGTVLGLRIVVKKEAAAKMAKTNRTKDR